MPLFLTFLPSLHSLFLHSTFSLLSSLHSFLCATVLAFLLQIFSYSFILLHLNSSLHSSAASLHSVHYSSHSSLHSSSHSSLHSSSHSSLHSTSHSSLHFSSSSY